MPAWCWPELVGGLALGAIAAWAAWFVGYSAGWWDGWLTREGRLGERSLRIGHDFETFGSVNQDSTPGNLLPNQFRNLINGRFRPGGISERGGKRKYNPDFQLEGCPDGIFPAESTPRTSLGRLFLVSSYDMSDPLSSPELSLFLEDGLITVEASATPTEGHRTGVTYIPGAGAGGADGLLSHGGGHINADVSSKAGRTFGLDAAGNVVAGNSYDPDPGDDHGYISPAAAFDGDTFFVTSSDTNGVTFRSRVYRDVAAPVQEVENAAGSAHGFFPMFLVATSDRLVAPLHPDVLSYRNLAGAWATASMPVGATAGRSSFHTGCAHDDQVWFTGHEIGGAHAIFKFDGSAVTTMHTVNGTPVGFVPLCSHNGVLYYAYQVDGRSAIGKMNDAGFTDDIHIFPTFTAVTCLVSASGRLWALMGTALWSAEFPDEDEDWTLELEETEDLMAEGAVHPIAAGPVSLFEPQDNYVTTNNPSIYRNPLGTQQMLSLGIPLMPNGSPMDYYSGARVDSVEYDFRRIFVGPYERGVLVTPGKESVLLGITAPSVAPTLASTAGGTQVGDQIGYYSWVHKEAGVVIHESDLSPGSGTVTFTGTQQRRWTLPTTGAEDRVTHIRTYVSIDGSLPVFVEDIAYPPTNPHDEDITAFGDTPPVDGDGNLLNARGVPPHARFLTKWKNRVIYGPDPDLPYRFWMSQPNEPESVGPLDYMDTTDRESVTLLKKAGDDLAVTGAQVLYALTGYDETDFFFHKVSDAVGCFNYFAAAVINEILWFPGQLGIWCYVPGGTLRYMMDKTVSTRWERDYKRFPAAFETSIAINDREEHVYQLQLSYGALPRDRRFIGSYRDIDPSMGGQGPMRWTFDECNRASSTLGILLNGNSLRYEVYSGSCDGWVRKENVLDDADDDGDTGLKRLTIERPHFMPTKGRGGVKLQQLTAFIESEQVAGTLEIRAGDEKAYLAANPTKRYTLRRGAATRVGRSLVPESSRTFHPQVAGFGWIFAYIFDRPLGVTYGGEFYRHGEGPSFGRARQ